MSQEDPQPADAEWIRVALRRFEGSLVSYAVHLLRDPDRARDLVQEAFLRLCAQTAESRERIAPHLAEWLFTVCRNLAVDQRRKERRMSLLGDAPWNVESGSDSGSRLQGEWVAGTEAAPAEVAERNDSYSQVLQSLTDLPDNQQEVIKLKFQHGLSYKQISQVTKLSVTNVGFLIHTGIKTLKRRLAVEQA